MSGEGARTFLMGGTDHAPYLLALRLAGRRVTIIGGGGVAARRIPALLESGAEVTVVSPELNPGVARLADEGRIRWTSRGYVAGDCAGSWLVGAYASDPEVNSAVAREADAAGVWCVRADDAEASRAWTPASGRAGDTLVGVVSGDPRHSARIRNTIVAGLASGAIQADQDRAPGRDQGPGVSITPRPGVALVGGGPGDPGLITVRGLELLRQADVVIADRLAPRSLLAGLGPDVEIIDAAKVPRGAAVAQERINDLLVEHARAGRFVVRLKGGDPFIFGRGGEEVLACLRAGISVTVVPGVSSVAAVPAAAGVPLTHRGIAQEFVVASAHVAPDDKGSTVDWPGLAASSATLVLMMATEHLAVIADTLIRLGRNGQTPVSVIQDGTLPSQRTINARLDTVARDVAGAGLGPPAVVVVGEVVTISEHIFELCGGRPDPAPWGTFVPGAQGPVSSGPGEEGGSGAGSWPVPGTGPDD
jgi:uroporphyrin-III C-methyltransferase/precorrin-2 dehydrogenase/sirohydrochlorin ferrochelatase